MHLSGNGECAERSTYAVPALEVMFWVVAKSQLLQNERASAAEPGAKNICRHITFNMQQPHKQALRALYYILFAHSSRAVWGWGGCGGRRDHHYLPFVYAHTQTRVSLLFCGHLNVILDRCGSYSPTNIKYHLGCQNWMCGQRPAAK